MDSLFLVVDVDLAEVENQFVAVDTVCDRDRLAAGGIEVVAVVDVVDRFEEEQ